jgi:hypothetical protein
MTKVGNAERIHVGHVPSGEPNGNPKLALQVSHLTAEPWFADVSFSASPGKIIGIELTDHVVVGYTTPTRSRDWVSFRESNLL